MNGYTFYSVVANVWACTSCLSPIGSQGRPPPRPLRSLGGAFDRASATGRVPQTTLVAARAICKPQCTVGEGLVEDPTTGPVVEQAARTANAAAGTTTQREANNPLSGAAQDALFWLAERALKRDVVRANRMARRVASTDPQGPSNRADAIGLFGDIQARFCGSEAVYPSLTAAYRDRRMAVCAEVAATKLALVSGLNHFGLSATSVLYLSPQGLEEMRDRVFENVERNFPASAWALPETLTTASTALARNEAELVAVERAQELFAAEQQRATDLKAYESALAKVKRNIDAYTTRASMVNELAKALEAALKPTFADVLSLAVSVGSAIFTGIGAVDALVEATAFVDTLHGALASSNEGPGPRLRIRDIGQIRRVVQVAGQPKSERVVDALDKLGDKLGKDAESILDDIKTGAKSGKKLFGAATFVAGEPSTVGAGVCNTLPTSSRSLRTLLRNTNSNAAGIIDEMLKLIGEMDDLSAAACDLAEEQEVARLQSLVAQTQVEIAELRVENTWRRLAFVDELERELRSEREKQAARRDTMCSAMHYWSDQAQLADFLAARASWFVTLDDSAGYPASNGDFQANMLDPAAREQVKRRAYVTDWEQSFHATSDGATVSSIDSCVDSAKALCAGLGGNPAPDGLGGLQQTILDQFARDGLVTFNLDAADHSRILNGDALWQRVTAAEVTLWNASGGQLYAQEVQSALRVSHGATAVFAKDGAWKGYLFPPTASSGLCRAVLTKIGSARVEDECDIVPKFNYYPGIPTPAGYRGDLRVPTWLEAQWNLFGTSVLGQWTLDLRELFRGLNKAPYEDGAGEYGPGCYPVLAVLGKYATEGCGPENFDSCVAAREAVDVETVRQWRSRAEDCLGDAFSVASACDAQHGACHIDVLSDRLAAFSRTCGTHLSVSSTPASKLAGLPAVAFKERRSGYCALSGECEVPPEECDQICGKRCQEIKGEVARIRFTVRTRKP